MRIALLTGTSLRHKYMAHQLADAMDVVLVVAEKKSTAITAVNGYSPDEAALLRAHFESRDKTENAFFGNYSKFPIKIPCIHEDHGGLHNEAVLSALKHYNVDAVALFGSSIVKEPILSLFPKKVVNLHLGLSPYYRGSGTNFFPLLYGEPECLGATFHLATAAVDAGGILHQFRPEAISKEDSIHTVGNTIIQEAGKVYPKVLAAYLYGTLLPTEPITEEKGKLFRIRDFTPQALQSVHSNMQDHLKCYLDNKTARDLNKPIVEAF